MSESPSNSSGSNLSLEQRCAAIDMLILDVDGVLTDGSIIYADNGVELKNFHVRDGAGLKLWQHVGKKAAIISGRTSNVVEVRAEEVGIEHIMQGAVEKLPAYRDLLAQTGLQPEQICYVGDDVPDLPLLRRCGLAVAVADAAVDVLADAHYVTKAVGGYGAVREVVELILRSQGHWQRLLERFRDPAL
jgi:3-deoxy-D-manno-octulosonate 8-phosphate phosphatase (KDO 8-P phosphatase)